MLLKSLFIGLGALAIVTPGMTGQPASPASERGLVRTADEDVLVRVEDEEVPLVSQMAGTDRNTAISVTLLGAGGLVYGTFLFRRRAKDRA